MLYCCVFVECLSEFWQCTAMMHLDGLISMPVTGC